MAKEKKNGDSEKLSQAVVAGMQEKKANEVVLLDLRNVKNAIADYFVICSASSDKHLEAIADSIDEIVFKKIDEKPWRTEGRVSKEWMIVDYINVVAHVFLADRRKFYSLEKLWGDAEIMHINDQAAKPLQLVKVKVEAKPKAEIKPKAKPKKVAKKVKAKKVAKSKKPAKKVKAKKELKPKKPIKKSKTKKA